MTANETKLIGIVGPCGAGKTSLANRLNALGYTARAIAQEHSYVPDMWQRLTRPSLLIFLQASHPVTSRRRKMNWTLQEWEEQQRRLEHARRSAHLYLETDHLTLDEVLEKVLEFLKTRI
ncbi:MAG: hypothetical protein N2049_01860 [Anaerolineales bacterium]|nr:hypothetical protein [Anaerolineales bacterium]MCX7607953.1 hypothetical protein [Anaerolineales bacterium]MDW8228026.1 hypothetical protein [Anaerolineales bacterium]